MDWHRRSRGLASPQPLVDAGHEPVAQHASRCVSHEVRVSVTVSVLSVMARSVAAFQFLIHPLALNRNVNLNM